MRVHERSLQTSLLPHARRYGIIFPFLRDNIGMCMLDEIRARRDEIYAIARKHKAEKLWVFGSCARREERPDSDVDFLVKFSPGTLVGLPPSFFLRVKVK